ncbi:MAG: hypothetical protein M3348_07440 [Acidobacteriota bacterium]|nr:hypothetical protein [Acidobacteriota bacterium]
MYRWTPCKGPSPEAVERMRAHFRKPRRPMGEAWFMGTERYLYTELSEKPLHEVSTETLCDCLWEIASGTGSFGHREEWDEWLRFLLPTLISRSQETFAFDSVLEETITASMVLFWDGLGGEYEGFRDDALNSLGLCLMKEEMWGDCGRAPAQGSHPHNLFLLWEGEGGALELAAWDAGRASEVMSASLFFCLKYLRAGEMPSWVESLAAIEDPCFRAALAVWLLGAYEILKEAPVRPERIEKSNPRVTWHNSFLLGSSSKAESPTNDWRNFLPPENCAAFLRELRRTLTPEVLLSWAETFAADELLSGKMLNTADLLFDKLTEEGAA